MSEVVTNMKVRFGADTRGLQKGSSEGKDAVKQFTGEASNNLSNFASVFGVNMGAVTSHIKSVKTGTVLMGNGFKGAAVSSSILTASMRVLKLAFIATGIGLFVVALGALASYFTKTQRGANVLSRIMSAFGAIIGVIVDRASALGEKIAWAFSHPVTAVVGLWEALKTNVINRITGIVDVFGGLGKVIKSAFELDFDGIKSGAAETGVALTQALTGLDGEQQKKLADGIKGVVNELKEEASAANLLKDAKNKLERQEVDLIESYSRRRAEVDKLRLAAKDETILAKERKDMLLKASELEKSILSDQLKMQSEKVRILAAQQALGENMLSDDRELAEEKARLFELQSTSLKAEKKLKTEMNTLDNEIAASVATAFARKRKAATDAIDVEENLLSVTIARKNREMEMQRDISTNENNTQTVRLAAKRKASEIEKAISEDLISFQKKKIELLQELRKSGEETDNGKSLSNELVRLEELETAYSKTLSNIASMSMGVAKDLQVAFFDFGSILNDSMKNFAEGFGENVGNLLSGVGDVQNFSALVASTLADMAIKVGKIAIGTGIAMIGIRQALMSMNPYAAIAGGIALVALGTWAKSALAAAADGNSYESNSSAMGDKVDTTRYGNVNNNIDRKTSQTEVRVSGEFRVRGNNLVAVIEGENKRRGIVT